MMKKILTWAISLLLGIGSSYAQFEAKEQTTPFLTGGNACPEYTFKDLQGKEVKMSDLQGKYVYIDVWASWCGPCLVQLPELKKLEEQLEGYNITFLSLSIDEDAQACQKAVEKNNMTSLVWIAGPEHQITKDFDIRTIPRFILLDPQGIIIHNRMSRPGYPPTAELLKRMTGIQPEQKR